jgi:hypothetical protein
MGALAWLAPHALQASDRLEYEAPPGCPTPAEFRSAVEARGGRWDDPAAGDRGLVVSIRSEAEGFSGALQTERSAISSEARHVHGATCAEVVDALAVVTALALRPESTAAREPVGRTAPAPHAPAAAPAHEAAAPSRAALHYGGASRQVTAGTLRFDAATGVTAFGGVALGVVPGAPMPRFDVAVSRASFVTLPSGESYLTGILWRARLSLLGDVSYRASDSTTEVGGQSLGISPCYAALFDPHGLALLFCAELSVGILGAETRDLSGAKLQSDKSAFGTIGLGSEAFYNLGSHFQLALKLGADASVAPLNVKRSDGSTIFRSSWLSGYGMLGLGGHW